MIRAGKLLMINAKDNVAVALARIAAGEALTIGKYQLVAREDVESGHKIALENLAQGRDIIKYGFPMGRAVVNISAGEHVHTHNVKTNLKGLEQYRYTPVNKKGRAANPETATQPREFAGYVRKDGQVGIRNEIWIINTVGCVNKTSENLAKEANVRLAGLTDGLFAYTHPYGCSQLGEDHRNTQKILAQLTKHPNAAGVLVLGLGCENNNIDEFKKVLGDYDRERVKFMVCQDVDDEMEHGVKLLGELARYAQTFVRQPCDVSKLVVGLKCGGSDAFSGITANPLVGEFSDMLIRRGGTGILTEVPEMFGAEKRLMDRCVSREIFDKTVSLINGFKEYYLSHGQEVYENPSPGNKKGGISTLEEKSLGCIEKGGTEPVVDVLQYGERVKTEGLNLLAGPGNDIVACTALTAAGAHVILFTTGRGTPLGAPVPTIKISTNRELSQHKGNWIDFDAGRLLTGEDADHLKHELFGFVVKVASGELRTKNEENGYREIAIFKQGVTL
ncbi:MAG TPA: altronate dehydratase family protein [Syntrophorhabdaceae bacterium]|nr:altronate dehydratase family protein [Syntrophorhabdaceae bacterium]